jgi:hypothetical protein
LQVELTESAALADAAATVVVLQGLHDLGVRLALDDFGTGHSSLAYLKRFPVDAPKVGMSFIDGLGRDPQDTASVGALVTLGHALGLRVIVEGVETDAQRALLRALGCDTAQGYLSLGHCLPRAWGGSCAATRRPTPLPPRRPTSSPDPQRHHVTAPQRAVTPSARHREAVGDGQQCVLPLRESRIRIIERRQDGIITKHHFGLTRTTRVEWEPRRRRDRRV